MAGDQKLTERTEKNDSNVNDLVHIVRDNGSFGMKTGLLQNGVIAATTVGNAILKGGYSWTGTGLDYYVWVDSYIINSVAYNNPISDTVTLSAGHATLDRFDVFALQLSATEPPVPSIVVVEGTPSASPVEPSLDLTDQVKIGLRLVLATETVDTTTTVNLIYDENVEWTNTTLPSGASLTTATDPYSGTKNFLTPAADLDSVSWTDSGLTTFASGDSLIFAFRTVIQSNGGIQVKLINSSSGAYWLKSLTASDLKNFVINDTADLWYLGQIKFSEFQASSSATQYDRVEIAFKGTAQFELDKVEIQGDLTQSEPTIVASPFELIDEGNGEGIIVAGRIAANYGNVGDKAVDLSYSGTASETIGASGASSVVSGGEDNEASNIYCTVSGGDNNKATGRWATVGGGKDNEANNDSSVVAGGSSNRAERWAVVGGGSDNIAGSQSSVIGGGDDNITSSTITTIAGGNLNRANGFKSTISGGSNNTTEGDGSVVVGGEDNVSNGHYAITGGINSIANSYCETVFGSYPTDTVADSSSNFVATDRLFNLGNGTDAANKSDAITLYKNGGFTFHPVAEPTNPEAGMVYYDSTSNKLRCYNGTIWNDLF